MTDVTLKERINESEETKREFAQEEFILDVSEEIWALLESQGMTKVEIAEKLNKSQAYISQILNGSRNMTLRTLSDIAFALNCRAQIKLCETVHQWDVAEKNDYYNVRVGDVRHIYRSNDGANSDVGSLDWTTTERLSLVL